MSFALIYALGFTNPPLEPSTGVDFWSRLRQLQSASVLNTLVTARDIHSDTDFWSNPLANAPGLRGGDDSPSFIAFPFRTNQVTKKVRPGQKRIVGVLDTDMSAGGTIVQATRDIMDNLAIEMTEVQSYDDSGQVLTFKPAVCAREAYTTPSGGTAYRYYATEAEQLTNTAQSVVWTRKGNVTSQVTRKVGRGV